MYRTRGSVLIEALSYKPKGRRFETRRDNSIVSIYLILPAAQGSWIYTASNRNEYQRQKLKCFWEVERGQRLMLIIVCEPIVYTT
jgi:hypothetical protein